MTSLNAAHHAEAQRKDINSMNNITWKISGAAATGLRHSEEGTPCQDKIFSLSENGVTAIALADGAGSARLSHFGAEEVTKAICEKLCAEFDSIITNEDAITVKRIILDCLLSCLGNLAEHLGCNIRDLASTLLAAASDGERIMLLHIGDGIIACFRDGKIIAASNPDNGEYKNETFFVTSHDAVQRLRLMKGSIAGISGIALMSDGTDESFYSRREKKFAGLLGEIRQHCIMFTEEENNEELEELFRETVRRKTRDDCSMIIMSRPDEYFRGYRDISEEMQYDFLGAKTPESTENREKIFSILSGREYVSRSEIIKSACKLGLKRRQVTGLIRDLHKRGFIERVKFFPKRYRMNFYY